LLLAAAVLLYFLVLLRCLRDGSSLWWAMLGAAHALAYCPRGSLFPGWLCVPSSRLSSHLRPGVGYHGLHSARRSRCWMPRRGQECCIRNMEC
jgi:hypothetical protein